ncbi:MAG: BlaI/MecI/CopY family transcriptional regulator [Sedimentisphaerales bacterium]|nr:BlaI/MecI/CopY family transcriptional regulator [Sedimentisphaerales bacterium]
MSDKPLTELGELQRAVLEIIWQLGRANVHEVRHRLARKKKLAYTTVLTTLQKLEKTGWLTHETEGKSYIYIPTSTRLQAGAKSLKRFIKHVFNGDPVLMFQHLIRETDLDDADLKTLKQMIDQERKEKRND